MRSYFFCLFCWVICISYSQNIPDQMSPPRLVNDFTGLFSPKENALLESKLRHYHDTTSTQIYVVTVTSFNGYDKAQFAFELGEKWGVGQKGKNNGAVILIKPKSKRESGEIFIASGYGLEGALPDITLNRIINEIIIPDFQQGKYYDGVNNAIDRMIGYLSGEYEADQSSENSIPSWVIVLGVFIIIIFIIYSGGKGNKNSGNQRGFGRTVFFPPTGGGSFGGFSGGGSSGGGFSGGGGGKFGGGGAGGKW